MGKALDSFRDFQLETNNQQLKANTESGVLAEVQSQTYLTGLLAKGKAGSKIVKSGKAVTSYSQFTAGTQSSFYQPGDTFTSYTEDFNTMLTFPFRFLHDSYNYLKHLVEFNSGGPDEMGVNTKNIDYLKSLRQGQRIGMYNTVESAWWTTPSLATMETATTATRPYSIRCFITEDGLHPSGFTTLAGIASTQTRYRNQVSTYTAGAVDSGLKPAFANMLRKVNFTGVPSMEKYLSETQFSKFLILTDINGAGKYQEITENSNDRLIGSGKDLGALAGDLPYNNIPVKYIKEMDGLGYASNQPRYFWINSDYLYPVFNTAAYFAEMEPMNSKDQPHAYTVHVDHWYQLICPSRQRLGIVCPG